MHDVHDVCRAFFDIEIGGAAAGRIEMCLRADVVPETAHNFEVVWFEGPPTTHVMAHVMVRCERERERERERHTRRDPCLRTDHWRVCVCVLDDERHVRHPAHRPAAAKNTPSSPPP